MIVSKVSRNPFDCSILYSWVFDFFVLADEPFEKALHSLETCRAVRFSCPSLKSPTTFDKRFYVTSVPFFISDFNLLSWELDKFTFKVLYRVILYWYDIKAR